MINAVSRPSHATTFPARNHDHAPCVQEALERARRAFETKGLRLTDLRRTVLEEIIASHRAIGAYDIIERLGTKGQRLAPISVYRSLDALLEVGAIHRLESRNAFFACHRAHRENASRLIMLCDGCGRVGEVEAKAVFDGIAASAAADGFTIAKSVVEVAGRCHECSPERKPAGAAS